MSRTQSSQQGWSRCHPLSLGTCAATKPCARLKFQTGLSRPAMTDKGGLWSGQGSPPVSALTPEILTALAHFISAPLFFMANQWNINFQRCQCKHNKEEGVGGGGVEGGGSAHSCHRNKTWSKPPLSLSKEGAGAWLNFTAGLGWLWQDSSAGEETCHYPTPLYCPFPKGCWDRAFRKCIFSDAHPPTCYTGSGQLCSQSGPADKVINIHKGYYEATKIK